MVAPLSTAVTSSAPAPARDDLGGTIQAVMGRITAAEQQGTTIILTGASGAKVTIPLIDSSSAAATLTHNGETRALSCEECDVLASMIVWCLAKRALPATIEALVQRAQQRLFCLSK